MEDKRLKGIFAKFAGQEVPLLEKPYKIEIGQKTYEGTDYQLPENNPVIEDIEKTAAANGLTPRIWTPGVFGTTDWNPRRVNIYIERADDGKWRIKNDFIPG